MTRLWGDGPPLWAIYGLGETGPRFTFTDESHGDLAHLAAVPAAVLRRAGVIFLDDLRNAR